MSEFSDVATRPQRARDVAPETTRQSGRQAWPQARTEASGPALPRGKNALLVLLILLILVALTASVWGYANAQGWLRLASASSPAGQAGAPQPTPSATARQLTAQQATQMASALVAAAANYVDITQVAFTIDGANGGALAVRVQEPDAWDAANVHEWVRLTVWEIMRAVWTSALPLSSVAVEVDGRLNASVGAAHVGKWGNARLTGATAATFSWQALNQDTAWSAYTSAWLIPTKG